MASTQLDKKWTNLEVIYCNIICVSATNTTASKVNAEFFWILFTSNLRYLQVYHPNWFNIKKMAIQICFLKPTCIWFRNTNYIPSLRFNNKKKNILKFPEMSKYRESEIFKTSRCTVLEIGCTREISLIC